MEEKDILTPKDIKNIESFVYSNNMALSGYEIKKLLQAYKQNEKVIEQMAEFINKNIDLDEEICVKKTNDCYADIYDENSCKQCIIEYFRKKCE